MTFGLTDTGFAAKPLATILSEIETEQRGLLGADLDTSAEEALGQINGIISAKLAEVWELLGIVYAARDPESASFASLDAVVALTGTTRRAATKGTVTLTLSLNALTTVAAGAVVSAVGDTTNRWVTTEAAINATGGAVTRDVAAEAQAAGRVTANAGTLTVIASPTAGWTAVTNLADADPGENAELDPALRARRELELAAGGTSPADAVRADLLEVDGVTQAVVIENDTDFTVDGVPPHSLECIVIGGTDAAVALAIWRAKAGGISTHGGTTVSVLDAQGTPRAVKFTRPLPRNVWVQATIRRTSAYVGDAAFKNALLALNDTLLAGDTVQVIDVGVLARAVRGVADVSIKLGTSSGYFAASNVPVGQRQRARLDSTRITVLP